MKYIVVIGSVMSGIGKGITASSIGRVLQDHGIAVTAIKIDPYLNPDSGLMSPFEHGECYVLDDGGETDLDLGNYERFMGLNLTRDHNLTTGKIYTKVIEAERNGKYLGKTVQIVPHLTNAIQEWLEKTAKKQVRLDQPEPQVCIIELGGTIGDFESAPYVEALRQMSFRLGSDRVMFVNVCYIPVLEASDETKTKPAQNGIRELRRHGINPNLVVVRCQRALSKDSQTKLSNICQIPPDQIILNPNVNNLYQIPQIFHTKQIYNLIDRQLRLRRLIWVDDADDDEKLLYLTERKRNLLNLVERLNNTNYPRIRIGIVGKYTGLGDSYLSLCRAIQHAAMALEMRAEIQLIDSETPPDQLDGMNLDRMIIPGGFGVRGIEGMIQAAHWARTHKTPVPCLGICLGFQVQVIEYARNVLGLPDANSLEFNPETINPVITVIDPVHGRPVGEYQMGATLQLGLKKILIKPDTQASTIYNGQSETSDRHRHRYEVNPEYIAQMDAAGLCFSGTDETGHRMEILEIQEKSLINDSNISNISNSNSLYMGVQFHPEYLSRPDSPRPIFLSLLRGHSSSNKNIYI